jgi:hypothetical protein
MLKFSQWLKEYWFEASFAVVSLILLNLLVWGFYERGRITVKKEILDTAKIQPGDTGFFTLTGIKRKEV